MWLGVEAGGRLKKDKQTGKPIRIGVLEQGVVVVSLLQGEFESDDGHAGVTHTYATRLGWTALGARDGRPQLTQRRPAEVAASPVPKARSRQQEVERQREQRDKDRRRAKRAKKRAKAEAVMAVLKDELADLQAAKNIAVTNEDYAAAGQLKAELATLEATIAEQQVRFLDSKHRCQQFGTQLVHAMSNCCPGFASWTTHTHRRRGRRMSDGRRQSALPERPRRSRRRRRPRHRWRRMCVQVTKTGSSESPQTVLANWFVLDCAGPHRRRPRRSAARKRPDCCGGKPRQLRPRTMPRPR